MTISIWRYSHLTLAISSALFIIIAVVTGAILAFEPITNKIQPYNVEDISTISIAETITVLKENYAEVITLEVDENDFVSTSVVTEEGKNKTFYINPKTGKKIGELIKKLPLFAFTTNLHRSLFLKSTGRFIIGFISFLLFLISITGVILISKRQGGFKKIFSKIIKENFNQYYHIVVGRYFLIPIIIITITGIYLSLEKFSLLPKDTAKHQFSVQKEINSSIKVKDFDVFKNTKLNYIRKIEFPFSNDIEDFYFIKLNNDEIYVNQYNGEIVSKKTSGFINILSQYSFTLHTGQGSILWSIILLLASFAILFFIFSGFSMTLKRRRKNSLPKNKFYKDKAEYVILVGSETGNTSSFVNVFYNALIASKKTVFISELNNYSTYKNVKNIIVFTATYGEGEAPTNAKKFEKLFSEIDQKNTIKYAVVGFGSKAYPNYCKYAIIIDSTLQKTNNFIPILPLFKINNQSYLDFRIWVQNWSNINKVQLEIPKNNPIVKPTKEINFKVVDKTNINNDNSFLIELSPFKKQQFKSGDLLSITPKNETRNRLYSIGKLNNNILLSIKKHNLGICSNLLRELQIGDNLSANIKINSHFHFPKNSKEVIMISNGTGIAPFLGMLNENKKQKKIHLFWGGRTSKSLDIYKQIINSFLKKRYLTSFHVALSQEKDRKIYVQDLLWQEKELISKALINGNVIMICGSLAMQKGVVKVLEKISKELLNKSFSEFEKNNQIKIDCY